MFHSLLPKRFGSLPYHGISNSQVVEYVKAGNKLCLSEAIPEDLRELLARCWEYECKDRPTIKDIVEILEENSEMISPYLEAPVASIPVEGAGSLELMAIPWAADRAAQGPQGVAVQQQPQQQQQQQHQQQQLGFQHNGTHGGGGGDAGQKRAKTTKSLSSFTDGQNHHNQPRSPLGRNFSHPSTTSTTTTSQDHCFMEAPLSLESQHPKLSLEKSGGRFFLRSNSEDVSDSNSPPPTPTAQITSFFNSAVNSAAQALRKQPSKANSLGFSSTPSPSASGLTTPMTLTPTKHPVHPQYHPPQQQQHHQQHLQNFHHQGEGQDGDFCVSPPDLFPLRPLGQSRGFDGVTSPVSGRDTVDGGFAKPQLMTSPSAPYSPAHQPSNPNSSSNGSSFSPQDAHFGAQNPPPTFVG